MALDKFFSGSLTSPARLVTLIQPSYANKAASKPPLKPAQKEILWPELKEVS